MWTPPEDEQLSDNPEFANPKKSKSSFLDQLGAVAQKSMAPQALSPTQLMASIPSQLQEHVFNPGGQAVAEQLAQGGPNRMPLPPQVAAGIGTGLQMIPDLGSAAMGLAPIAEGVKAEGLVNSLKSLRSNTGDVMANLPGVAKLRGLARIMTGPGEAAQNVAMQPIRNAATGFVDSAQADLSAAKQVPQELTAAKQELAQTPAKMNELLAQRQGLVQKAGKNIQSLEVPLGELDSPKIKMLIDNQEARQATLQDLTKLTSKGVDAVNSKMTARDIQQMRQFAQEVARNPELTLEAPQASQINQVLGQAMDKHIPGYKDALELYKTSQEALEEVPNIKAQELGKLRSRIKDMGDAFTNSKLNAADSLKKAQLNAKQIMQKADMMVQQGKLSDVYRQRLYKGIVATGILGGAAKFAQVVGGH